MAYPDAYARQYDYQSYQNLNPTRPLPADKVNADLNAVATFASEVVSFLSTSIRDDGQIMNGAVGYDQLSAELQTNSIAPATPWATATAYAAGKSVMNGGSIYRCVTSHTSGTFADDLTAGYWILVGALPAVDTSNTFAWTGSHTFSLAVGFADGSAAVPSIGFTNDTDTGLYRIGVNKLGISAGGTNIVDIGTAAVVFATGIYGSNGAVGAPAISFSGDTDSGLYWIAANNIGIAVGGTKIVDVGASALASTVNVYGPNGAVGTPAFSFSGDTDSGLYWIGANNLGVAVGGTKVVDIASAGLSITSAGASAFAVGLNGATNPAFRVDAATGSQAAGLKVAGAATGGTVAIAAIDSGSNTNLTLDAKGSGTIDIGGTSTGGITIGATAAFLKTPVVQTMCSTTATPAGGSTSARLLFGTTAGFGIYYGSGAPTVSAAAGSIYIRTDNAGANLRLYSNTTGSTTWAAITSA